MKGEGFLSNNISGFTRAAESIIFTEDLSRTPGLLQGLDARVKVLTFLALITTAGLVQSLAALAGMLGLIVVLAALSRVPAAFFLRRVFILIPIFTLVVATPALFITPGDTLLTLLGRVTVTEQGARAFGMLVLRVTDSMSLGMLLILATPWVDILAALRWFHMPALVVTTLGMTYRHIFLLLHTTNEMFLARRSRTLKGFSGNENRRWLARALATTMIKAQHLSEEVYLAMLSRGYQGEAASMSSFKLQRRDAWWVAFVAAAAFVLVWWSNL